MPTPIPSQQKPDLDRHNPGNTHWQSLSRKPLRSSSSSSSTANNLRSRESSGGAGYSKSSYNRNNSTNSSSSSGSSQNSSSDTYTSSDAGLSASEIAREGELAPSTSWQDNTSPQDDDATNNKKKKGRLGGVFKKGGPLGVIIAVMLALAGVVSFFGGPGLMIIHITENITEKYSLQLSSVMQSRANKIVKAKLKNSTTGFCGATRQWRCKYATFSEREIKAFKKVGIELDGEVKSYRIGGIEWRKPEALKFKGHRITAENLHKALTDIEGFDEALKTSFNPHFASFSDKAALKIFKKNGTSKKAPFENGDNTDEKRSKRVKETVKEGHKSTKAGEVKNKDESGYSGDDPDGCSGNCPERKAASEKLNGYADGAESQADKIAKAAKRGTLSKVVSAVKITGAVDDACSVYGMYKATALGVKIIRNRQLIRFAMITLVSGNMAKAMNEFDNGNTPDKLSPENIAFVGNMWTRTERFEKSSDDSNGNKKNSFTESTAATNALGYRNAAYGDTGMDDSASAYTNGGSFGGQTFGPIMTAIGAAIDSLGGRQKADSVCKVNNNIFVQGAVLIGSIALMFVPGAGQGIKVASLAAQAALAIGLQAAQIFLPSIIADIISGNPLPDKLQGEAVGNATVSGAGAFMSQNAISRMPVLTADQAAQQHAFYENYRKEYARYQRSTHSPLDATSKYTFMGSIYNQFMPTFAKLQSGTLGGMLGALGQIARAPAMIITTKTKAATGETYDTCKDVEVRALNGATDLFCNYIGGITGPAKNAEVDDVINTLDSNVDDNENPTGDYANWIKRCNESDTPIGNTGTDSTESDGKECMANETNGYYGSRNIDKALATTMSEGFPTTDGTATTQQASTNGGGGSGQAVGEPEFDQAQPAAEGGDAISSWNGLENGKIPDDKLVALSFSPEDKMHKQAAEAMEAMNKAYQSETGSSLGINEAYRDCDTQIAYATPGNPRYKNGLAKPAPPCSSNHGWGLAADISVGDFGSSVYNWLSANAHKYGFVHPAWAEPGGKKPEAWHWEYARKIGGAA